MRPKQFDEMIVSFETPERIALWENELGVPYSVLQSAVRNAGPLLNDVREELGLARIYIFPRDDRMMQRMLANGAIQRG